MFMMRGPQGGPGTQDPGRIRYSFTTLRDLLTIAYDVKRFQIQGPQWLDTEHYDVQATMPPETTKEQFRVMLQNLLAERFKMAVHHETKDLPMYSLIVAKSGPKLTVSKEEPASASDAEPPAPPPPPPPGPMKLNADGFPNLPLPGGGRGGMFQVLMPNRARLLASKQTMKDLAERLSNTVSRPVVDMTGLTAKYDFTLTFSPEGLFNGAGMVMLGPPPGGGGRGPADGPDVETPPDLFAAIQAQLGLKLEAKKGPVDLVVVDRAEKTPTEN